ncbi:hypothetical protein FKG94_03085 [Exilibacterium tricleocarpae]|uniref:Uncharacterized protein n=1 Tax=Exilibacterium tricleocarpae TaxID=2591008 RepID=A0A545U6U4_9GAMM|nr:hypothetical protein [Exilibacterium tricleocarpae]TQV85188.1 hypothetical protein FKG94_03085 [Exilibacterium tricleocarpae]
MATVVGSASDRTDFLDQLVAFAITVGYTDLGKTIEGSDTVWHLLKDGYYFHFRLRDFNARFHVDLKLSRVWANEWYNVIPNGSHQAALTFYDVDGPYVSHKFFSNGAGDYIYIALEVASGMFNHMGFGVDLDKNEAWTGGGFCTGGYYRSPAATIGGSLNNCTPYTVDSRSASFFGAVHHELPGIASIWAQFRYRGFPHYAISVMNDIGNFSFVAPLLMDAPGPVAPEAQVHPMELFGWEDAGQLFIPLGAFYDIGVINIENLTPDTIFTVGSDQWHVYPVTRKNGDSVIVPNSANMGIAYRIVP